MTHLKLKVAFQKPFTNIFKKPLNVFWDTLYIDLDVKIELVSDTLVEVDQYIYIHKIVDKI